MHYITSAVLQEASAANLYIQGAAAGGEFPSLRNGLPFDVDCVNLPIIMNDEMVIHIDV